MRLDGKTLLILTGCNGARDIVRYAQHKNVTTVATDYHKSSSTKDSADYRYDVSTTDIDGLHEIAVRHRVDGITTGTSEASMYSILRLTERLGLPFYATENQLDTINNKRKFKSLLKAHDVGVVQEYGSDESTTLSTTPNIEYPVVVKPVDSCGAKGISVVRDRANLPAAYESALRFSRSNGVIVEKCMKGLQESFFNYTIVDGTFSVSCGYDIHRNFDQDDLLGLPIAYSFPSKHLDQFIATTHPGVVAALRSIGIENGTMSIQCFVSDDSFLVFEAGYRLGGAQMYVFTRHLTGIDVLEMMVNFSLTGRMTDDPNLIARDNPHFERPCCQLNVPVRPGTISVLEGIEEIESIPGVLNVTRNHTVGDDIKGDNSLGQMCLRIHITGESKGDVSAIINRINGLIRIEDQNGCDMVLERHRYAF